MRLPRANCARRYYRVFFSGYMCQKPGCTLRPLLPDDWYHGRRSERSDPVEGGRVVGVGRWSVVGDTCVNGAMEVVVKESDGKGE